MEPIDRQPSTYSMEDALERFVQLVTSEPEENVATKLLQADSNEVIKTTLVETGAVVFANIETLAKHYVRVFANKKDIVSSSVLSGLTELWHDNSVIDAETIWGQVELQNTALLKLLKKSVKQLERTKTQNIILLENMDSSASEEEEEDVDDDESDNSESGRDSDGHAANSGEKDDEDEEIDEETKRIKARMERALGDMEAENDDDEHESEESSQNGSLSFDEEDLEKDKDAADLHDGFFNLQEMEEFADEEEEYLPDAAFGDEEPDDEKEDVDKRTFHQKQRDGDVGKDDSDDSDEENDLLFRNKSIRRRKYRKDEEIDALYKLYDDKIDSNEDDNVLNMTAEDFFGKPKMKYIERYQKNNQMKKDKGSDNKLPHQRTEPERSVYYDGADAVTSDEDEDKDVAIDKNKKLPSNPPTKQAAKIIEQTEQIEKEMLAEKPWQMTGETTSTARPVNSLLEATPEFEAATKIAPLITVQHTENIEEIIKRRILAEDWDDVIPRELPDVAWHKKRGELPEVSQEKSKLSLGELYEREYLKKAAGYDVDAAEKGTAEEKAKNEMKSLFANLCSKLDALSNYHFAPRPIADEAEVRAVTQPAIAMEEVMPIHVSDARAVAPEEVYAGKRGREGILRADSELDQQERKRLRSSKKSARRKARQAKLADEKLISRLQPGLGLNNPYEKRKIREELAVARAGGKVTLGKADMNDYSASGTFFQRMQQEAELSIQKQKDDQDDRKAARSGKTSSALKL